MKKQILLSLAILLLAFTTISAQQIPKTISGGVLNGKALSLPKPDCPAAVGARGSVSIQVLIDEQGYVSSANAVSGHPLLRGSATGAAKQAVFSPTTLSGQPVKVSGVITYLFACGAKTVNEIPLEAQELADDAKEMIKEGRLAAQNSDEQIKTIRGGVINGKALSLPKPEYPAAAKEIGASGNVNVEVVIDEGGNIISAKAVSGHPLLKQSAEQAARQARFAPTLLSGQPVKVSGVIVYNFSSTNSNKDFKEETKIMELGAFFSFFEPMLKSGESLQSVIKSSSDKFPQFAENFETLKSLNKNSSVKERKETIDKTFYSIKRKLNPSDTWQLEIGNRLGKLMVLFKDSEIAEVNESVLKTELLEMRDLIFSAPNDFPAEVLNEFKAIAKFADEQNLDKTSYKQQVFGAMYNLLHTISPRK